MTDQLPVEGGIVRVTGDDTLAVVADSVDPYTAGGTGEEVVDIQLTDGTEFRLTVQHRHG